MSETWLDVGSTQSAARVVLRDIKPQRGVGTARLIFTFEVATKRQDVADCPVWLGGRVGVLHPPRHTHAHLAPFQPQVQLLTLPRLTVDRTLKLTCDISDHQLQLIEERRSDGGVQLNICLSGYGLQDGQPVQVPEAQFTHDINQGDWISLLERAGYRRFLLLELEALDSETRPHLAEAINHYIDAQHRFREGEWRLTVENLRQSLASLVGKKADDEEQEIDVEDAIKTLRKESRGADVGYEPRLDLVRQAAKFLCDLGAHPEVAETRRHHAYAALVMVGGLLNAHTGS